ncbi:TniQ family protein [Ralstonia pseudosolanacearum]|uniref:TniQ family protein n=1 Tax=Ralstonia pseudosolanacearum TaxID=1310165 RepID=UPI001FFA7F16|nr:TniQ family protein [Ralstonia pseudosolanacearum]
MKTWSCAKTPLWPIRYKPIPGELLSSWIVRLAHGHGMRVTSFCNHALGARARVMAVDVDRFSPEWLLASLASHTATRLEAVRQTTLRAYEGALYRQFHAAGYLPWVISIKLPRNARLGPGLQFCPYCLRDDPVPHFRLRWRVALQTFCERHRCFLLDRCPSCGACLFIHRVDVNLRRTEKDGICHCYNCDYDLRLAQAKLVDDRGSGLLPQLQRLVQELPVSCTPDLPDLLGRLHAMAVTLLSRKAKPRLCDCLAYRFGCPELEIELAKKPALELQSVLTRHASLLWSLWLLEHDTEARTMPPKPLAPLHHRFIKDILVQYRRDAGFEVRRDSSVEPSQAWRGSTQVRDGRVVQLH